MTMIKRKRKIVLLTLQICVVATVILIVSGLVGMLAYLIGAISWEELVTYFEGVTIGDSIFVFGGTWLKRNWEKLMEIIEGTEEPIINQKKIDELRKLLRK
jgi:arginine exporter protein ArgO